jgi:NADH:ubiquinone oxidoreductase subunit D
MINEHLIWLDVLPGTLVADTIAILGSIDIVVPEVDR